MVEDVDGNRFLDFNAGIAVVATGHCHPRVVEAIQEQAGHLIHMSGTDFYYEELVDLAEKLGELAPGGVERRVSFCNSGAEAVEGAIKLARYATGRDKFIAFFGAFHGRTMGALSLTARKAVQRRGFGPLVPGVVHAPYPNCYRCPFGQTPANCAVECVEVYRRHAAQDHCAGRGNGRHRHRAGAGRRRIRRAAAKILRRADAHGATSTAFCWCATKCNRAWAAPARCGRPSIST